MRWRCGCCVPCARLQRAHPCRAHTTPCPSGPARSCSRGCCGWRSRCGWRAGGRPGGRAGGRPGAEPVLPRTSAAALATQVASPPATPSTSFPPRLCFLQIPGLVVAADMTSTLAMGYWPSFNVPYFPEVRRPGSVSYKGPPLPAHASCAPAHLPLGRTAPPVAVPDGRQKSQHTPAAPWQSAAAGVQRVGLSRLHQQGGEVWPALWAHHALALMANQPQVPARCSTGRPVGLRPCRVGSM